MVTFGSRVGNHQFQPFLSGVYAGVIDFSYATENQVIWIPRKLNRRVSFQMELASLGFNDSLEAD